MNKLRCGHFALGTILVVDGVGRAVGGLGIFANILEVTALAATEMYDAADNE